MYTTGAIHNICTLCNTPPRQAPPLHSREEPRRRRVVPTLRYTPQ
ncbi:hypothetical protein CCHL11_09303 [Colletotrichum chlorophyti]|uniref:Uncharacterized protein n=1 Tax=Colletotrichum chlorophyti TaxID=708187 RepID=A0A1Q8RT58_9PEZI|nr:hypothetical protein CCHL11_09303 [Colletotrichum chlorophyti]